MIKIENNIVRENVAHKNLVGFVYWDWQFAHDDWISSAGVWLDDSVTLQVLNSPYSQSQEYLK